MTMTNMNTTHNEAEQPLSADTIDRLIEEHAWPELFRDLYSRPQPSHAEVRIAKLKEDEDRAVAERDAAEAENAEHEDDTSANRIARIKADEAASEQEDASRSGMASMGSVAATGKAGEAE
jgi:hypothetical protein